MTASPTAEALTDQLGDRTRAVATDFTATSDVLLVAFGGMRGQVVIPPFEFAKLTEPFGVKRLFIRDLRRAWYHRGVAGLGETIDAVASALGERIASAGAQRVITVGNSSGGYAALTFGWLLEADEVVAFSPRTQLGYAIRLRYLDRRALSPALRVTRSGGFDRRYTDLRRLFESGGDRATTLGIHYSALVRSDMAHAERLSGLPGVRLHPYAEGDHGLVQVVRTRGTLQRILADALRLESTDGTNS